MRYLWWLILLAGCSPPAGSLTYAGLGVAESSVPFYFKLRVRNDGDHRVDISNVSANVTYKCPITPIGVAPPADFDYHLRMLTSDGDPLPLNMAVSIAPLRTQNLPCEFQWNRPDYPMIVVVRASFTVRCMNAPGNEVTTPEKIFIVQSQVGALDAMFAKSDPERAAEIVRVISELQGDRSEGVADLLKRLGK